MSLSERLATLNRVQRSRVFMIAATAVVVLLAAGVIGWSFMESARDPTGVREALANTPEFITDGSGNQFTNPGLAEMKTVSDVMAAARSPVSLSLGVLVLAGIALLFVWLGLGLTYLGVTAIMLLVGLPLALNDRTQAFGFVIVGGGQLSLSFVVLLRAMTLALSPSHPTLAIARNVLAEAVRMKISMVFIMMLIAMLAVMPLLLNGEQPLRFRVQAFLQYANGMTFWVVALLVLFFGVATVAFEQRDKIIWQTMTKPVSAMRYVLGKWLGVVSLAAVLLLVSSTGVFVFTEYLRRLPANGEVRPYEPRDPTLAMTEDRLILETRVLTARKPIVPAMPFGINEARFDEAVAERVAERERLGDEPPTPADLMHFREEAFKDAVTEFRSIDPNTEGYETYEFYGLGEVRRQAIPLTLRYKINAEGNRPDIFYALTFIFEDGTIIVRERTGLGFTHTLSLSPEFINPDGVLRIQVFNGELRTEADGTFGLIGNTNSITIPPDGLEISYRVGTFRGNFLRVQAVQWVKLAFLAMLAVCSATFLSFPVACLVSIGVFFIAESSGWVAGSLSGWGTTTTDGKFDLFRFIIYHFAGFISSLFTVYDSLNPTQRLSDGRVLSWGSVASGTGVLGLLSLIIYTLGSYAFRSRQLAMYSGQ